jgi:hypothetical protein
MNVFFLEFLYYSQTLRATRDANLGNIADLDLVSKLGSDDNENLRIAAGVLSNNPFWTNSEKDVFLQLLRDDVDLDSNSHEGMF